MTVSEPDHTAAGEKNPGVGPPARLELPMFTYGLLQPGQLAHRSVVGEHVRCEPATLPGAALRLRDGVPVLDLAETHGAVHGYLVWFEDSRAGYERVGAFEPRKQYRWDEGTVLDEGGRPAVANMLVGRRPRKGSTVETFDRWDCRLDPVLTFGFEVASSLVEEVAADDFPVLPGESPELWDRFFRLSGAYLLLWSVVERYTALRFGPAAEPHARVRLLDASNEFRAAVTEVDPKRSRSVVDSRDPEGTYSIKPDGSSAATYWYAVRSNLSHRGKSAFQDGQLLRRCALDLRDVMRIVLERLARDARERGAEPL